MCDVEEYLEANENQRSLGAKNSAKWEQMRYPCRFLECHRDNTQACQNEWRKASCVCKTGWEGELCYDDVDECAAGTCVHASNCTNTLGSFECDCEDGWTGEKCDQDIDECAENMCQNGAFCANSLGSFECQCTAGWTGLYCEEDVNECEEDPCNENTGLDNGYRKFCINTPGSFTCACNGGKSGENCDEDYDECSSNPCGDKICVNGENGFSCQCPEAGCQLFDAFGYLLVDDFPEIVEEEYEIVGNITDTIDLEADDSYDSYDEEELIEDATEENVVEEVYEYNSNGTEDQVYDNDTSFDGYPEVNDDQNAYYDDQYAK